MLHTQEEKYEKRSINHKCLILIIRLLKNQKLYNGFDLDWAMSVIVHYLSKALNLIPKLSSEEKQQKKKITGDLSQSMAVFLSSS